MTAVEDDDDEEIFDLGKDGDSDFKYFEHSSDDTS